MIAMRGLAGNSLFTPRRITGRTQKLKLSFPVHEASQGVLHSHNDLRPVFTLGPVSSASRLRNGPNCQSRHHQSVEISLSLAAKPRPLGDHPRGNNPICMRISLLGENPASRDFDGARGGFSFRVFFLRCSRCSCSGRQLIRKFFANPRIQASPSEIRGLLTGYSQPCPRPSTAANCRSAALHRPRTQRPAGNGPARPPAPAPS